MSTKKEGDCSPSIGKLCLLFFFIYKLLSLDPSCFSRCRLSGFKLWVCPKLFELL